MNANLVYVCADGEVLPSWVKEGARVKVVTNSLTREYGLTTLVPIPAGSVGTIKRREGNGWWDWVVEFEPKGGHWSYERYGMPRVCLNERVLEDLRRVPKPRVKKDTT